MTGIKADLQRMERISGRERRVRLPHCAWRMKFAVRLACVLLHVSIALSYNIPPKGASRSVAELDGMISQCLMTLCKEWMAECHWFCDSVKSQNLERRCMDCLGWRGEQCKECFDL